MADLIPQGITKATIEPVNWGGIDQNIIHHMFKDGRITGLLIEHWFNHAYRNVTRSGDEATPFDLYLRCKGQTLHYQSKVSNGKPFDLAPSYMKGKGRKYNEAEMRRAVSSIDGYVLTDLSLFPALTIWTVPAALIVPLIGEKSCKVKQAICDELAAAPLAETRQLVIA